MIVRPRYLDILRTYRDVPLVKILAGIRRSGKSTILEMLVEDLVSSGIPRDHMIRMRYTSENFEDGMTSKEMYQGINEKITDDDRYYLLLDEVQEIDGWEKAVNALLEDVNTDIYVTGSNSKLMSSEISTYLTGRYISIPVYTLSFGEYLEFKKNSKFSKKELLNEYIRMGGFPIVASGDFDEKSS
ncbi:MAG: AAA family ATPase, partial [Oscillospiraceae bacterium]